MKTTYFPKEVDNNQQTYRIFLKFKAILKIYSYIKLKNL